MMMLGCMLGRVGCVPSRFIENVRPGGGLELKVCYRRAGRLAVRLSSVRRLTASMFSFNSRINKQILFQAWRLVMKTIQLCAVSGELARIELHNKRRANSIWQANKAELVEIAYRELPDARRDHLQKMNLTELRERVRQHRATMRLTEADPLMKLPAGLDRLKKEELMTECLLRGIVVEEPVTRPKMIVAIKDDVQHRRSFMETAMEMEWTAIPANRNTSRSSGQI